MRTKNLTRDIEEVVVKGSMIGGWVGEQIDRIHVYRWDGSGFIAIPFQIDHVGLTKLEEKCPWQTWGTDKLCEYNYQFDNNGNEEADSSSVLANRDELVFLARDSGSRAPNTTIWPAGYVSTVRYEIEVLDRRTTPAKKGWVYAFLWLEEHPQETVYPYYVQWTPGPGHAVPSREEDSTCHFNVQDLTSRREKACGLFEGLSSNLPNHETYNLNFKGNWIINRLQLKPPPPGSGTHDVLDRRKYRGTGAGNNESELNWSTALCAAHHGNKTGRIRTIYVAQGTQSGIGTTITYKLYPTHSREIMRLRVHENVTNSQMFTDYLSGLSTPPEIYVASQSGLADTIDGTPPISQVGQAYEAWTQVNSSQGRIVEFVRETRAMQNPQSYYYEDLGSTNNLPESNAGAYGNHGRQWKDPTPRYQDRVCLSDPDHPSLKFRQIERTLFYTDGGVGTPPASDEAADYLTWMDTPLETMQRLQNYTIPIPPPAGYNVCAPTFNVQYGNDGRNTDLTPATTSGGCTETGTVAGFRIYRAIGMGAFKFLAKLNVGQSHRDLAIYRGQTYRYYARSFNPDGIEGPSSPTYSVLITDTDIPTAPPSVTATAGNQSVALTWANPESWDLRGYNVYVGTAPGGPYLKANAALISGIDAHTVQGLVNNTTYYFVVRSKDWGDNESVNSAEVSAAPHP